MKFTGVLQNFDDSMWGFHIMIPQEIAEQFITDKKNRRVVCSFRNGEQEVHCALMPDGLGGWFISVNKALRKSLSLNQLDEIEIEMRKDTSKYGMPMPQEFQELLEFDEEGSHYFHQLTPGKQRSLIHFVSKYKSSDKRLDKALVILDYLKEVRGKLDWEELNHALKTNNK